MNISFRMDDTDWERTAAVYLPLTAALLARLLHGRRPRQFAACLLSVLWAMPTVLAMQCIAVRAGWWSFSTDGPLLRGMPLELYVGWVLLWGLLPQLVFPQLAVGWSAMVMIAVDLIMMPMCSRMVHLGPQWLVGEAMAVLVVLVPSLCIARWTRDNTHLRFRSAIQVVTSGMLFLYLLPEIVFGLRPGEGWGPLLLAPSWCRQLEIQVVLLFALPGVSAVMEFADRGCGTPIPYDPPQRLVTSGIYRYCANPMQMSCAIVMLLWAMVLHNAWLILAASMSAVYSAGIAEWDESEDLSHRFGREWRVYRAAVHNWRLRWRPYHAESAACIYIAGSCGPCSEIRSWLEARRPLGLQIVDAETLPSGSIRRISYDPGDGGAAVDGVRALGRALEHLNLGWALSGAALRLPGVWQCVQLLMDASGLGPRDLVSTYRQ